MLKRKSIIIPLVLLLAAGVTTILVMQLSGSSHTDTSYEYLAIKIEMTTFSSTGTDKLGNMNIELVTEDLTVQKKLDKLGERGWELVDVVASEDKYILKRPLK